MDYGKVALSQVSSKADKTYVDTQIASVNAAPKGVYATQSQLQSAFPTGNTNIYFVTGNVQEVDTLTVTAIPTASGNVTVTLNGIATNIAVDPATDTTISAVATKIRNTAFAGWTTGGSGSTVTFTATAAGVKSTPLYSAGSTGSTGTMLVTTAGINADGNWYYWNGSTWVAGGLYLGTGITSGSVAPDKTTFFQSGKNLFNSATVTTGKYVNNTTGALSNLPSYCASDYISVQPSTIYACNATGQQFAWYDNNKTFVSGGNSAATMTPPVNVYYVRLSIPNANVNTAQFELGSVATAYEAYNLMVDVSLIRHADYTRKYLGKKWNAMGDSITALSNNYASIISYTLGINATNYGIGGSTIAQKDVGNTTNSMCLRYGSMDTTADLITVFGGTNDWGSAIPLGSQLDTTGLQSFRGALKLLIEGVITQSPQARLLLITPYFRKYSTDPSNGINAAGLTLLNYVDVMTEMGALYGIPVLDLYRNSGINTVNIDTYTYDRLHPNAIGYARLSSIMGSFISNN